MCMISILAMSACCLLASSTVPRNAASVVEVGGVPRFAIDGKPMTATAVMPSPAMKPGEAEAQLKAFRDAGAMLSSDVWTMYDKRYNPRQWWLGDGEYDFALFDALAKALVDAAPDGFIFPRIKLDPPAKWIAEHPEEMMNAISAKPESQAWRTLYRRMLKDVVAHVEASSYADRVIGYHLGAFHCGEWLTGEWKAENRAYIPSVPFGDGEPFPPLEATAARRAAISQRADAVADVLIDAATCVKEETGGRRIVGAFFGYQSIAHEKVSRVVKSGKVDFFAAPPVYFAVREPGHSGRSQAYYQASYRLHGCIYYEESDFRTYLSDPAFSPPNQTRRRPLDESIGIIRRSVGKCLAGGWENWWFLLGGNDTFAAPEMMESIRIGAKEERDTLLTAQWTPAEVAVFTAADEYITSVGTHAPEFRLLCKENLHRDALPACGVPFDSYELSDIADPRLPDYKVYVFPNAFTLSEERLARIKERVCRAGKTAVWIHKSPQGLSDGDGKGGWKSVVMPLSPTAADLRKAFRDAGAHVWIDTDDILAVGRGYVMVHAASNGTKKIRLEKSCDVREIFGASPSHAGVTSISLWMNRGETRVWRIDERLGKARDKIVRDVAYADRPGCVLDLRYPSSVTGFPTVVWLHGGGLTGGKRHFVPLTDEKIAQVAVEYRLLGKDAKAGTDCIEDAAAAVAWTLKHIADYGGDKKKVFVSGMSAGGYLTMMVGMDPKYLAAYGARTADIAGLVAISGQATKHFNVRKFSGDLDPQFLPKIDDLAPLAHVSANIPPILCVCGQPPYEWKCRSEENRLLIASCVALGHKNAKFVQLEYCNHSRAYTAGLPYLEMFAKGLMPE